MGDDLEKGGGRGGGGTWMVATSDGECEQNARCSPHTQPPLFTHPCCMSSSSMRVCVCPNQPCKDCMI